METVEPWAKLYASMHIMDDNYVTSVVSVIGPDAVKVDTDSDPNMYLTAREARVIAARLILAADQAERIAQEDWRQDVG